MTNAPDHDGYPATEHEDRLSAVRAGLKQHRSLARVRLNTTIATECGLALREHLTFLIDLAARVDRLPFHQRAAIQLASFAVRRCDGSGADHSPTRSGAPCPVCNQWVRQSRCGALMEHGRSLSNEDIARHLQLLAPSPNASETRQQINATTKLVARWKTAGIQRIATDPTLWRSGVEETPKIPPNTEN